MKHNKPQNPSHIISWNVNGIRACAKKGFGEWLQDTSPHLLGLQETKAWKEQIPELLEQYENNYTVHMAEAEKKGYSGVALFCHKDFPPLKVQTGLGIKEFDSEGRTLIAHFPDLIVYCCYFPNGQRDHSRVPYKMNYCDAVMGHAQEAKQREQKQVLVMGDINTAHTEIDLANPKSNKNTTGFLPEERAWVDKVLSEGWHDIFREQHEKEEGHYTWWTYRSNCREKNVGWRIDYFLACQHLADKATEVSHLNHVMGSDHCPIEAHFSWE